MKACYPLREIEELRIAVIGILPNAPGELAGRIKLALIDVFGDIAFASSRVTMSRICSKCFAEKPYNEYWTDRREADGLYCICRECAGKRKG